jgi:hypothetical protein
MRPVSRSACANAGHATRPREELDVVGYADDAVLRERLQHAREREIARLVPHDELGDHRS